MRAGGGVCYFVKRLEHPMFGVVHVHHFIEKKVVERFHNVFLYVDLIAVESRLDCCIKAA